MKIQSINNNLNFQKQLKARCAVVKQDNKTEPCNIYKLDFEEDKDYFSDLSKNHDWENSRFLSYARFQLPRKADNASQTYVLENKKGDCLGFCELTTGENDFVEVIETYPKQRTNKDSSANRYKYIGETLLAFLAKEAKAKSVNKILLTATENSKEFYKKAGMKTVIGQTMCLENKDYDSLIKNNANHTGAKINLTI